MTHCANCNHPFSDANPYFSEDFACYFCQEPMFLLTWCYHCTHTAAHELKKSFFGKPQLSFKTSVPVHLLASHHYFVQQNRQFGGFAGAHLLRMVWHCLNARAGLEVAKSKQEESAMHLAMRKLLPREAGLMAQVTIHAPEIVPLEQQIQEGLYLSENIPVESFQSWVHAFPNAAKAKEVWAEIVRYG